MDHTGHHESSLRDVYRIFFRHRRTAITFAAVVMSFVVLYTIFAPRTYRSEAAIFVRLGRENVVLDPTATLGQQPVVNVPNSREDELNSAVEILQSRVLLQRVVDAIGPEAILTLDRESTQTDAAESPEPAVSDTRTQWSTTLSVRDRAVLRMQNNLSIHAVRKSNVIRVSYDSHSPKLSQDVVAQLLDSYLDEHVRLNRTPGAHAFLADQTQRLQDALTRREEQLRDLKNKTGLVARDSQRRILVERIGRLDDDLLKTESQLSAAQAEVAQLRKSFNGLAEIPVIGRTTGLPNEAADEARKQLYDLQFKEQALRAKYTDEHFEVRQIRRQIEAAKAILNRSDSGQTVATDAQGSTKRALGQEPILMSLRAQAATLREQLATAREQLKSLTENELQIAELEREIEIQDQNYRRYSGNLEQARIDQSLEDKRISNIGIVQPATFNARAVRPNKLLSLALGFMVAVFGGLGLAGALEYLDHSFKTPHDVVRNLELPLLASIPQLDQRDVLMQGFNGRAASIRSIG